MNTCSGGKVAKERRCCFRDGDISSISVSFEAEYMGCANEAVVIYLRMPPLRALPVPLYIYIYFGKRPMGIPKILSVLLPFSSAITLAGGSMSVNDLAIT